MIAAFSFIIFKYVTEIKVRKVTLFGFFTFLVIWISYNQLLIMSGLILSIDFPPRIPIFVFFPLILIIAIVSNTKGLKSIVKNMPVFVPIGIQSFRVIVELLIFESYKNGILPEHVTFSGYNFDIIVGLLAIPAAYLVYKTAIKRRAIIIWNVFGLSVLTVTLSSFIYSFYLATENTIDLNFIQYPIAFLPTVLLPFAIFFHVISLSQVSGLTEGS